MKLLFLHGAPAVGKLTVAKALLRIVPGRLMDNHAAIDGAHDLRVRRARILGACP
jgi:tRNA uridine 5-carbamoylmethylation protein Kti12